MKKALKIFFGVLLLLAALLGIDVAATWAPDRTVAELAPRWAPPPSQFVPVMGMRVHLRDEGPRDDPSPIVLLHGTSASLHTWEGWTQALKGTRRVIRFDLPGFGLTGPFPDNDYSMEHYVAFVLATMDQLQVQHFTIAGNSFGGNVAWETASWATGRVDKLVLVDAAGYPFKAKSTPIAFRIAKTPLLNKLALVTLPRHIIESSVRNVYGDKSKVTPELVDRYYELTLRAGNRAALQERFKQAPSGGDAARIPQLKLPTLVLWGGQDHLIPPDNAARFVQDIAGAQLVIFGDLGHVPQEEDPVRTVAALQAFLAGTPAPAQPAAAPAPDAAPANPS